RHFEWFQQCNLTEQRKLWDPGKQCDLPGFRYGSAGFTVQCYTAQYGCRERISLGQNHGQYPDFLCRDAPRDNSAEHWCHCRLWSAAGNVADTDPCTEPDHIRIAAHERWRRP